MLFCFRAVSSFCIPVLRFSVVISKEPSGHTPCKPRTKQHVPGGAGRSTIVVIRMTEFPISLLGSRCPSCQQVRPIRRRQTRCRVLGILQQGNIRTQSSNIRLHGMYKRRPPVQLSWRPPRGLAHRTRGRDEAGFHAIHSGEYSIIHHGNGLGECRVELRAEGGRIGVWLGERSCKRTRPQEDDTSQAIRMFSQCCAKEQSKALVRLSSQDLDRKPASSPFSVPLY